MLTKNDLAAAMIRECDICVHLWSKFDEAGFGYRPSPDQRSTLELLQYLSHMGSSVLEVFLTGDWSLFGPRSAAAATMTAAEFPAAMERQKAAIREFFANVSDETMATQETPLPGGRGTATLEQAILGGPVLWLPAYKLQLFLYAKASGAKDIGTSNAWGGMDAAPKG